MPRYKSLLTAFPFLILIFTGSCSPVATQNPVPATGTPQATVFETDIVTPEPWRVPEHRIGIRVQENQAEFFDKESGAAFVPRGVNYVFLPRPSGNVTNLTLKVGIYDPARTREEFAGLAADGYNTVRVFLDHCNAGPGCIGDVDHQGLNPAYLDNIADMMQAAKETGLLILFTSNDLPDQGGYSEQANRGAGETFAGYRNSYYLTPDAVQATRRYWRDLLTGLIEREAAFDAVLGWQLLNEQWMFADQPPLSLDQGMVETTTGTYDMSDEVQKAQMVSDGLRHYIAEVKAEILKHDPTALVTMGFFAPGVAPGWYVETASLLEESALDFFDFHGYPGEFTLQELAEQFGMVGYEAKPILLGEYGAFRHIYGDLIPAARAVSEWVSASCDLGFDGWLYWSYHPAGAEVNDRTWGFTDGEGYLQDLFAPINHRDPCADLEISSGNLAYQMPVRASRSLPEEPPQLAVDEVDGTQWGAGADAPQWIEVELEGAYRVDEVRLLVAQYPAGETVHRLQVRRADAAAFETVHEFRGATNDGDWLAYRPEGGLEGVTAIRVQTILSPSWVAWKEIQIYGE